MDRPIDFYFSTNLDSRWARVYFTCAHCGNISYQLDRELFPEVTVPQFLLRSFKTHEREHEKKFRRMGA